MYWWNIDALKKELRLGPLAATMAFRYVLANALLVSASVVLPNPPEADLGTWILRIITVGLTIVGLRYCYSQNGGASGRLFMDRYFAISWVVYMRSFVALLVAAIGVAAVASVVLPEHGRRILYASAMMVWLAVLYWRIGVHIRDVASNDARTVIGGAAQQADAADEARLSCR